VLGTLRNSAFILHFFSPFLTIIGAQISSILFLSFGTLCYHILERKEKIENFTSKEKIIWE
jgi:hypothetical protein